MKISGITGPTVVYPGTSAISEVVELPEVRGWHPRRGVTRTRLFKATRRFAGPANIAGTVEHTLQQKKVEYQIRDNQQDGWVIVEATLGAEDDQPDDVPLSDDWEREWGWDQKTLWEAPLMKTLLSYLPTEGRMITRAVVEALLAGKHTFEYPPLPPVFPDGVTDTISIAKFLVVFGDLIEKLSNNSISRNEAVLMMEQFLNDMIEYSNTFVVEILDVTRTRVVPLSTSLKPSDENVNKLFTASGMTTHEGFDAEKSGFDLPEGFYRKGFPKINRVGSAKRQIVQTYQWCSHFSKTAYPDSPVA